MMLSLNLGGFGANGGLYDGVLLPGVGGVDYVLCCAGLVLGYGSVSLW